jgi:predicted tellurium resistance membrane protein TerC
MHGLFNLASLVSLLTLVTLEIVLGIDNVIFVSILIIRLPAAQRLDARRVWMIAGILIRSGLLLFLGSLVARGNRVLFSVAGYGFSIHDLILLAGGLFLLYKTVGELHNKMEGDKAGEKTSAAGEQTSGEGEETIGTGEQVIDAPEAAGGSFWAIAGQIVLVDTVFSFDSIITAIGLAQQVAIMITAVVIAMIIMFFFSGKIADFINRRPTLKVLALSFLLMVGFSLLFDGLEPIHHTHIAKGYIYFSMAFAFGVELLNTRIKKKAAKRAALHKK